MTVLLYFIEGLFALLGAGVLLGSILNRRIGLLLPAAAYVLSAAASFALQSWWPLFLGFGMARLFGVMGVGVEPQPVQRPSSTGLLVNHGMHIFAGIVGFETFLFSGEGVALAVSLAVVLQGLDAVALHHTYSRLLADAPADVQRQLLVKTTWLFILKVVWYALITLIGGFVARSIV